MILYEKNKTGMGESIIISDYAMRDIIETVNRISFTDSTILITGESGTGKSLLAKYIHETSKRANKPFVTINCTTIPDNLMESELFGYSQGAFTNANCKGKPGLVETANDGTLFLDEIGSLPLALQAKFLQLIQEKTYIPVGSVKPVTVNVRIIAATNTNLARYILEKKFREDLYYRLRVIELEMPPLRERPDAFDPLIDHYIAVYNEKFNLNRSISIQARNKLKSYSWPGNVRELQYLLERLVATNVGDLITIDDIPPLSDVISDSSINVPDDYTSGKIDFESAVAAFEKDLLERAFAEGGSSYKVADKLNLTQSKASRLLRKYNIK